MGGGGHPLRVHSLRCLHRNDHTTSTVLGQSHLIVFNNSKLQLYMWINQTYKQLQTRWTSTRETILFFYLQTESANVSSRDENVKDPLKVLCIWYACEAYCGILFSEKLLEKHNHVFMYHECQTCLFWFNAQKSWKITWKTEKLKFFAQQPKLLIDNLIWALTTNILEARKSFLPNKSTSNFFLYQVRNLW